MDEATANFWAAIAFPLFGLIGCGVGGILLRISGRRKPWLVIGQIGKLVGIAIVFVGTPISVVFSIAGASIFGFANGFWMPALYCSPMDLDDMNPTRVGAAFALLTACALSFGFIAPSVGGWLTDLFSAMPIAESIVSSHVFGLIASLMAIGLVNVIGTICMLSMPETGPKHRKQQSA